MAFGAAKGLSVAQNLLSVELKQQQCILAMSDLQILTGLSILISGYVQLRYRITGNS